MLTALQNSGKSWTAVTSAVAKYPIVCFNVVAIPSHHKQKSMRCKVIWFFKSCKVYVRITKMNISDKFSRMVIPNQICLDLYLIKKDEHIFLTAIIPCCNLHRFLDYPRTEASHWWYYIGVISKYPSTWQYNRAILKYFSQFITHWCWLITIEWYRLPWGARDVILFCWSQK